MTIYCRYQAATFYMICLMRIVRNHLAIVETQVNGIKCIRLFNRVRQVTKSFHITSKSYCFCPKGCSGPQKSDFKSH